VRFLLANQFSIRARDERIIRGVVRICSAIDAAETGPSEFSISSNIVIERESSAVIIPRNKLLVGREQN